jgi:hypothetical protein
MAVNLSPLGNGFNFLSVDGLPLNAGKIYTYQAGSSTPLTTYTDVNGLIANTNPIILGTDGRPPSEIWLTEGFFYKFILKDSSDVTIQTYDNLYGIIGTAPTPPTPLPSGAILLWSGSIGSIPAGYYLCNGSNGTPDLRDRFVVGAGSTYAVDATGGSANSIVVSHTHTGSGTTDTVSDHQHIVYTNSNQGPAGGGGTYIGGNLAGPQQTSSAAGAHSHTVTITTASAGSSGTNANLPPYYALCYIMKS